MSNEEALKVLNYIVGSMAMELSNRGLLDAVKCGRDALKKQNHIVRCEECAFHTCEEPGMVYCQNVIGGWVSNDFYCADGEREEASE